MVINMWSKNDNADSKENKMRYFSQMIGSNLEWKVGDIDRCLKVNLKILIDE